MEYILPPPKSKSLISLLINSPPTPVTVGNPFPMTITARKVDGSVDTSFNGEVILSSSVPVGPSLVYLSNGVWNGQVNVLGDGSNLVLQAMGGGLSGTSNPFSTAGAASVSGSVSGVVTNDASNSVPIAGATVHLSRAANGPDASRPKPPTPMADMPLAGWPAAQLLPVGHLFGLPPAQPATSRGPGLGHRPEPADSHGWQPQTTAGDPDPGHHGFHHKTY